MILHTPKGWELAKPGFPTWVTIGSTNFRDFAVCCFPSHFIWLKTLPQKEPNILMVACNVVYVFLNPQLPPVLLCCLKYMNSIHSRTLMLLTLPCHWIMKDYSDVIALVVTYSEFYSRTCLMVFPHMQATDKLFFLNQIQVVTTSTNWVIHIWLVLRSSLPSSQRGTIGHSVIVQCIFSFGQIYFLWCLWSSLPRLAWLIENSLVIPSHQKGYSYVNHKRALLPIKISKHV